MDMVRNSGLEIRQHFLLAENDAAIIQVIYFIHCHFNIAIHSK